MEHYIEISDMIMQKQASVFMPRSATRDPSERSQTTTEMTTYTI